MREYKNQYFRLHNREEPISVSSVACYDCEFSNCCLSLTKEIKNRSTVSDVLLKNCTISASSIGPAILRRITVDGLITGSLFIVWGTLFDQVVFSGRIGKIKINTRVHHVDRSEAVQKPFDEFRVKFYENVEWAIDIRQAKFRLFEITGIPARLIRRDPETQMVVTRERALNPEWRSRLSISNTIWPFVINSFLASGEDDRVLVAPLLGPKKQVEKLGNDLRELRDLGIVF